MSRKFFNAAVKLFYAIDSSILSKLPQPWRQQALTVALKVKDRLFSAYRRGDLDLGEPERVLRRVPRSGSKVLPHWIEAEIRDLSRDVDPGLYRRGLPGPGNFQRAWPHDPDPARALKAMQAISPSPKYVLIAPWLKRGGADLVILKHLQEFAAAGPTCLITTEPGPSDWMRLVPEGVEIVAVGDLLATLAHPMDKRLVLARFLMQSGASAVHLINSRLGWETFRDYGRAISMGPKLFASVFCDDAVLPDGSYCGYAHEFLPSCFLHLSGILSDNRSYLDRLVRLYGIDSSAAFPVYVWTETVGATPPREGGRVLWAGRLDRQKRPDLLLDIARICPDIGFDVYGSSLLAHDRKVLAGLLKLPNVRMMGAYDGFGSIDTSQYSAFLYTTAWDGLPNVLLEAGMRGMGIVATAVDGIPELVTDATGWPIAAGSGCEAYAVALRAALRSHSEATEKGNAIRALVSRRHSIESFRSSLSTIAGYL